MIKLYGNRNKMKRIFKIKKHFKIKQEKCLDMDHKNYPQVLTLQ